MAKLKINDGAGLPIAEGYIEVVNKIAFDTSERKVFLLADEDVRSDKLQAIVTKLNPGDTNYRVKQDKNDGSGTFEEISSANCRIKAEPDEKKTATKRSKVIMPINDAPFQTDADLSYLDGYLAKIATLWTSDQPSARKFLFGMMMITRCR